MTDVEKSAEGPDEERPPLGNWMLQHPKYEEMMALQVGDEAQVYCAFLVYLDLTQVRQWHDVSSRGSPELQVVLLEGREKDGDPPQVVLPLPANRTLTHRCLRSVLSLRDPMLLCAVASDSSLVYQRLCDGLLTPDPPVDIQDQGRRQHRKRRLR
ncbi:tRNA-splicing endonuclease subunit Sen15 isoform X1 [Scleropages formosus]|nr:tRNA-splicing endonuclease subunit Sen15 isoform X1 [Scleropages formosus]